MKSLIEYRKKLEECKSIKKISLEEKENKENKKDKLQKELDNLIKARYILSDVSKQTQQNIIVYFESLVTLALTSIFNRNFHFLVGVDIKRNKSEVSFRIYEGLLKDREKMLEESWIPSQELGGGCLDIISLALKLIVWSLIGDLRNTLLFDEPFRFLGEGLLLRRTGEWIKKMSKELNLQLIINTHSSLLASLADKSFYVLQEDGKSLVHEIILSEEILESRDFHKEIKRLIKQERM